MTEALKFRDTYLCSLFGQEPIYSLVDALEQAYKENLYENLNISSFGIIVKCLVKHGECIQSINVSNNRLFKDSCLALLTKVIPILSNLKTLILEKTGIKDESVLSLIDVLPYSSIQVLSLGSTNITNRSFESLTYVMESNDIIHLKQLDVSNTKITDKIVIPLLNSIINHSTVEQLNLSRNSIGFKTSTFLLSKIPSSSSHLKRINLNYNLISHALKWSVQKLLDDMNGVVNYQDADDFQELSHNDSTTIAQISKYESQEAKFILPRKRAQSQVLYKSKNSSEKQSMHQIRKSIAINHLHRFMQAKGGGHERIPSQVSDKNMKRESSTMSNQSYSRSRADAVSKIMKNNHMVSISPGKMSEAFTSVKKSFNLKQANQSINHETSRCSTPMDRTKLSREKHPFYNSIADQLSPKNMKLLPNSIRGGITPGFMDDQLLSSLEESKHIPLDFFKDEDIASKQLFREYSKQQYIPQEIIPFVQLSPNIAKIKKTCATYQQSPSKENIQGSRNLLSFGHTSKDISGVGSEGPDLVHVHNLSLQGISKSSMGTPAQGTKTIPLQGNYQEGEKKSEKKNPLFPVENLASLINDTEHKEDDYLMIRQSIEDKILKLRTIQKQLDERQQIRISTDETVQRQLFNDYNSSLQVVNERGRGGLNYIQPKTSLRQTSLSTMEHNSSCNSNYGRSIENQRPGLRRIGYSPSNNNTQIKKFERNERTQRQLSIYLNGKKL